jgi:L-arabinose isomerase
MMETGVVFTGGEYDTKSKFVLMMRKFLSEEKFLWFVHNYSFSLNPDGTMILVEHAGEKYFATIEQNPKSDCQWIINVTKKGVESCEN